MFRDSEFVKSEIRVINELQDKLAEMTLSFPQLDADEREEYVEMVETLLNKQKILWARVELSKEYDETAALMASDVRKVMDAVGIPKDVSVSNVFGQMDQMVESLKKSIEDTD
tara:strand:+ start:8641 stop:8979 length:339 start_codon:yes stop_codon:yes gene_type:complete